MGNKTYIFDFDSTFTKVEALEILGDISLEDGREKEDALSKIKDITDQAMEGKLSFTESLEKRIPLLKANKSDLEALINRLKGLVSESVKRNKKFFSENKENVIIVSSGFKEFIAPVVEEYSIPSDQVYANEFTFDEKGNISGFDTSNPLASDKGKVKLVGGLNLEGDIAVIGDGYTDYEIREAGLATTFYAFTENVERASVIEKADHLAPNLDEVLFHSGEESRAHSYPKNRIKVLVLENIHHEAISAFKREGYTVEEINGGLDEDELCEKIKDVSIICIRSKTNITKKVVDSAKKLMAVGAFCIGTNQIDLDACTHKGIVVFNAPYSNTRSVVELAIGQMIILTRNIYQFSNKMHQHIWNKSAKGNKEIRGKKLGIIGYGNIGTQLGVVAEALGMDVYYYDVVEKLPLGNVKKCASLHDLLSISDVVTLHVDGRKENKEIIGDVEFAAMKDGVIFLNLSRGHVVDIDAMAKYLDSGKIRGAAVDVFPHEPKTNAEPFENRLVGFENVMLTPHIGGSTEEAQLNIGKFVPNKLVQYINSGSTYGSVNFPELQLPSVREAHRMIHIHDNTPGILAKINEFLSANSVNILGQYLKTNEQIGYVITDVDKENTAELEDDLRQLAHTIRFRALY